jgi:hypothetical protein
MSADRFLMTNVGFMYGNYTLEDLGVHEIDIEAVIFLL